MDMVERQKDEAPEKFTIELEMTENGRVMTREFYNLHPISAGLTFRTQLAPMRERVSQLMCAKHLQFPELEIRESNERMIIAVDCCCYEFMHDVSKRFEGEKRIK